MNKEGSILIAKKIHDVRGRKVMLDKDLAELYGVDTRSINQAVKRNSLRFPPDFCFQLSKSEFQNLISQNVISSWGGQRKLPTVFTEHGVAMLSAVLRSDTAVRMNITIIRAFIQLRHMAIEHHDLQTRIKSLEKKYDLRFETIEQALDFLIDQKAAEALQENRRRIGFGQ